MFAKLQTGCALTLVSGIIGPSSPSTTSTINCWRFSCIHRHNSSTFFPTFSQSQGVNHENINNNLHLSSLRRSTRPLNLGQELRIFSPHSHPHHLHGLLEGWGPISSSFRTVLLQNDSPHKIASPQNCRKNTLIFDKSALIVTLTNCLRWISFYGWPWPHEGAFHGHRYSAALCSHHVCHLGTLGSLEGKMAKRDRYQKGPIGMRLFDPIRNCPNEMVMKNDSQPPTQFHPSWGSLTKHRCLRCTLRGYTFPAIHDWLVCGSSDWFRKSDVVFLIQFNINYHCCKKWILPDINLAFFLHKMEQMLRQERAISTVLASLSNLFCILNLHHDCFYPHIFKPEPSITWAVF